MAVERLKIDSRSKPFEVEVRERAYFIFKNAGAIHGHDKRDWLQAEREQRKLDEEALREYYDYEEQRSKTISTLQNVLTKHIDDELAKEKKPLEKPENILLDWHVELKEEVDQLKKSGKDTSETAIKEAETVEKPEWMKKDEEWTKRWNMAFRKPEEKITAPKEAEPVSSKEKLETPRIPLKTSYEIALEKLAKQEVTEKPKKESEEKAIDRKWINKTEKQVVQEALRPQNVDELTKRLLKDPNVQAATNRLEGVKKEGEEMSTQQPVEQPEQAEAPTEQPPVVKIPVTEPSSEVKPASAPETPIEQPSPEKVQPITPTPTEAEEAERKRKQDLADTENRGKEQGRIEGRDEALKELVAKVADATSKGIEAGKINQLNELKARREQMSLWEKIKLPFRRRSKAKTDIEQYEIAMARDMARIYVLGGAAFGAAAMAGLWAALQAAGYYLPFSVPVKEILLNGKKIFPK